MSEISLDVWSILLVASAVQGLVLGGFLVTRKTQKQTNAILMALLMLVVWIQLEFFFVRSAVELDFNLLYGTRHGVWLGLGPLFYLYVRSFVKGRFKVGLSGFVHFLPFLVFTIIIPIAFANAIPSQGKFYGMLSIIRNSAEGLSTLQMFYGLLFFLQFIHASIYVFLGIRVLRLTRKSDGFGSMVDKARVQWIKRYSLALGVVLTLAVAYFVILFYSSFYERWMDYLLILPTTGLVYILVISALIKPYLFRDDLKYLLSQKKYAKSGLSQELADTYQGKLAEYMRLENPQRSMGVRLTDISEALSIPSHDLSQVINERFQCNFNEFMNGYRIEEAKVLLSDGSHDLNILEVAYAVGFNNKASFNNYFKKITGDTPSGFLNKNQKMSKPL